MYNIEQFQCELYDKYFYKKTDIKTLKMIVIYIYIHKFMLIDIN